MKANNFEDLLVWKKAKQIAIEIYQIRCKTEYGIDSGFKDQIQRAIVSVMSNIAEGFEYRNDKQFRRYLSIAKGSAGEVRSLVQLGNDLGYIEKDNRQELVTKLTEISKMISGLISSLKID